MATAKKSSVSPAKLKAQAKPQAKASVSKAATKAPVKKSPAESVRKSPVKVVAVKATPKPAALKAAPAKTVTPTQSMEAKPAMLNKQAAPIAAKTAPQAKGEFKVGSFVVYPTHGVGKIIGEETQTFGEVSLKVFVINFERDKMTLRVPVHRAEAAGLRSISGSDKIERALKTLKGKAKAGRGMWSRRAQEYEAKINSGCLLSVAEVVRDLYKNVDQSERSYSERIIFESAFNRMVGELAAAEKLDTKLATEKLVGVLKKQAA